MRLCFALVFAIWCAPLLGVRGADGPEDQFVQAFNLIQEADKLSASEPKEAVSKYQEAQAILQKIQKDSPNWNAMVIGFRLEYVTSQVNALASKLHDAQKSSTNAPPAKPAAPDDWDVQLGALKEQVRQLQADKSLLEAKVKEAFAAQPAQADPLELARVEGKLKELQKENELLKASLEKSKTAPGPMAVTKSSEKEQQALTEAARQLAEQKAVAARLSLERDALQSRLRAASTNDETAAALRSENQLLKKRLAEQESAPPLKAKTDDKARQLALAQTQLASLQSDKELLSVQTAALQARVKQLTAANTNSVIAPSGPSADAGVKELEQERDNLKQQLEFAKESGAGRKGKGQPGHTEELEQQVAGLKAQVEALEARSIPYTPEELALLKTPAPQPQPLEVSTGRKSIHELSPMAARLVSEARTYYAAGQYGKAENTYIQVLKDDEKNVPVLTDLASIQIEGEHLPAAETNVLRALALAPDSAYGWSVLGRLRFRQGKLDEAMEALSRAAKLEPDNAEIRNFLGLTLSHKGLRVPAEAALRKALELDPNYASAHNNLAVIYVTGKPPAIELARWHYQKALSCGAPHNPDLEKMLEPSK